MPTSSRNLRWSVLLLLISDPGVLAARDRLALGETSIDLPGAPAIIVAADVDSDGRKDLVIAVAFTEWDQIGIEESTEMDDIEGLVEVLTIVPALMDRRELWVLLADGAGGYRSLLPITLDLSVLTLEPGPPEASVVALTDRGFEALRVDSTGAVRFEPFISSVPVLAGTGALVSELDLVRDVDGDGRLELMVPRLDRIAVFGAGGGAALYEIELPDWKPRYGRTVALDYVLPETRDLDGDGDFDILYTHPAENWEEMRVLLRNNEGLGPVIDPLAAWSTSTTSGTEADPEVEEKAVGDRREQIELDDRDEPTVVYFGDLDGDGRAELVTQTDISDDDAGFRQEMKEAKAPPQIIAFHRTGADLQVSPEPYSTVEAVGFAFEGNEDGDVRLPGGFQDLDGDGRLDLVMITLDFSLMQAVRVMTTHRLSIGMDFHVYCQGESDRFAPVSGLDLSGKFKLDLDDLRIGQLSQFAGDFDGDGRADFVQIGRGKNVTIHLGSDGCRYAPKPDLIIELREEPRDLALVQVRDLDGDGLSDLVVTQPRKSTDPEVTRPVRLDLYLSGTP